MYSKCSHSVPWTTDRTYGECDSGKLSLVPVLGHEDGEDAADRGSLAVIRKELVEDSITIEF